MKKEEKRGGKVNREKLREFLSKEEFIAFLLCFSCKCPPFFGNIHKR